MMPRITRLHRLKIKAKSSKILKRKYYTDTLRNGLVNLNDFTATIITEISVESIANIVNEPKYNEDFHEAVLKTLPLFDTLELAQYTSYCYSLSNRKTDIESITMLAQYLIRYHESIQRLFTL